MATIKVFTSEGVKELHCFDTLDSVEYMDPETGFDVDPFEEIATLEPE